MWFTRKWFNFFVFPPCCICSSSYTVTHRHSIRSSEKSTIIESYFCGDLQKSMCTRISNQWQQLYTQNPCTQYLNKQQQTGMLLYRLPRITTNKMRFFFQIVFQGKKKINPNNRNEYDGKRQRGKLYLLELNLKWIYWFGWLEEKYFSIR